MSYYNFLYHVIFQTKYSIPAIDIAWEKELYTYIWGFIKNKGSKLYRIGGMPDHLHILMEITPKIALADFIRDLKTSSAKWLKGNSHFRDNIRLKGDICAPLPSGKGPPILSIAVWRTELPRRVTFICKLLIDN